MTKLLTQAFEKATQLSREEQDGLGRWLLEELADEKRWAKSFAGSQGVLSRLGDEALEDHRQGRTAPLDPDAL